MPRADSYAAATSFATGNSLLGWNGSGVRNFTPSAVRGYIDASLYADLAESVINNCDATTGWTRTHTGAGAPIIDTSIKTTGFGSIYWAIYHGAPTTSRISLDLGSDTAVGLYSHVAIDLRYAVAGYNGGGSSNLYVDACVATAVTLGGTVNTVPWMGYVYPSGDTWYTVYIPLTGLTTIRSIGIRAKSTNESGGTIVANYYIDNVRFANATGLDQAIHAAGTSGKVVIPPHYTTAFTQTPLLWKPSGVTVEDQRSATAHHSRDGGDYYARDYMLDATGTTEVSGELNYLYNVALPENSTFHFEPQGQYKIEDSFGVYDRKGIITEGHDAILFQEDVTTLSGGLSGNTAVIVGFATCQEMIVRDVHVRGNMFVEHTGANNTLHAGTPVVSGTTMLLDASGDTLRFINLTANEPMGMGRDRHGNCKITFVARDTAQVASDVVIQILRGDTQTFVTPDIMFTTAFTLTSSNATYTYEFTPVELDVPYHILLKKATATANTITVESLRVYRVQGAWGETGLNSAWAFSNCDHITLERCSGESIGGDGYQISAVCRNMKVHKFLSRVANRQGLSANWCTDVEWNDVDIYMASRQGVDVEPYAPTWIVKNLVVNNMRIRYCHQTGFLAANWGAIYNLQIRGIDVLNPGNQCLNVGAQGGIIDNAVCRITQYTPAASLPDIYLNGRDMVLGNHVTPNGVIHQLVDSYDENSVTISANYPTFDNDVGYQSVAYAATVTADPRSGSTVKVGTLTGNIILANPTESATGWFIPGQKLRFILTQDATGGRTMTFGNKLKKISTLSTTASKINTITFVFDGTNWNEIGAAVGI